MSLKSGRQAIFAALVLSSLSLQLHSQKITVYQTTRDRSSLLAQAKAKLAFKHATSGEPALEVDETKTFQTMDGFGFALTGGSAQWLMRMDAPQRDAILRELFGRGKDDISASYLRVSIGASDLNDHVFSYDDLPDGATDTKLEKFDLGPDKADVIPVLRAILAINPHIQILGSPWSAPAWMKTNGKVKDGALKPEYYPVYAQYFVRYLQAMHAAGIPITAITVQNEPLNGKNTPSLVMTAEEQKTFIRDHLGPAFEKANIKTKIILYDHNCDVPEYPLTTLDDPAAAKYVDGSGFHLYEGDISAMSKVHDRYPAKNLYFTEQMVIDGPRQSELDVAEPVKRVLIRASRNWSRNVLLWNLAADPKNEPHTNDGGCTMCEGAITIDGNKVQRNVAYYVIAHASKFVPSGSQRIASTTPEGLANVAFRTPAGKIVLIVANDSEKARSFRIQSHGATAEAQLLAGSVATYLW